MTLTFRADGKLTTLALGLVGLLVLAACGDDKFGPKIEEGAVQAGVDPAVVVGTPNKQDWERLSRSWRALLDDRIAALQRLRDDLTGCIGCGCLTLRSCALFNRDDKAAKRGPGARRLSHGGSV